MPFSPGSSGTITGSVTISGTPNVAVSGTPNVAVTSIAAGQPVDLVRRTAVVTLTIAQTAALSDAVDMTDYAGGEILMSGDWTAADLGAQLSDTLGGTYATLKDSSNAYGIDVSIDGPVASAAYPIPPFWFGAHFLKLHSHNGSGTNTNQAAARSIKLLLKS
jgi:hypothetical protein